MTKIKIDSARASFSNSWCNQPRPPSGIGLKDEGLTDLLLIHLWTKSFLFSNQAGKNPT